MWLTKSPAQAQPVDPEAQTDEPDERIEGQSGQPWWNPMKLTQPDEVKKVTQTRRPDRQ